MNQPHDDRSKEADANAPSRVRRTIHFSGRVQGVGFRFLTHAQASDYDVGGYVRNLPDGRVELVAEGTPKELDRFRAAIESRMRRYIDAVTEQEQPATSAFSSFEIAHD